MSRHLIVSLLLCACAGDAPGETGTLCPPASDPCMDDANHAVCLEVEASCDGSLLFLESCPLQFACDD